MLSTALKIYACKGEKTKYQLYPSLPDGFNRGRNIKIYASLDTENGGDRIDALHPRQQLFGVLVYFEKEACGDTACDGEPVKRAGIETTVPCFISMSGVFSTFSTEPSVVFDLEIAAGIELESLRDIVSDEFRRRVLKRKDYV